MRHGRTLSLCMLLGAGVADVGCSDPAAFDPSSTGSDATGSTLPGAPPAPTPGYQIPFGPFDVPNGESQLCRTVQLPNTEPVAINRIDVNMNTGSHHYIVFRSKKKFPDQTFECWGTVNFEDWEFVVDINRNGGYDWQLEDGQGFVFEPGQQLMIQAHYVNAKQVKAPEGGMTYLNLHTVPLSEVKHELHGMFTVNTRIAVPPYSEWESSRVCTFNKTVRIVAMTGHFHQWGRRFRVNHVWGGNTPDETDFGEIYRTLSWDTPEFKLFDPPLLVNDGAEGVRFACMWENNTSEMITFGSHADIQEHCNLFFHYYYNNPADELGRDPSVPASALDCAEGIGGW